MDELLGQFLIEGRELVADAHGHLEALATDPADTGHIDGAFRAFHTLKGSVGLFNMEPAGRLLHAGEDILDHVRSGKHHFDRDRISLLIKTVDQIDRWIDAIEQGGQLPPDAAHRAKFLITELSSSAPSIGEAPVPDMPNATRADWLIDLLEHSAAIISDDDRALVAFRYEPDEQCFLRGDDPMKIVTALPDIVALRVRPREDWATLDDFAPFECHLVIEGVTAAPANIVRSAFVAVGDEVKIVAVPPRLHEQAAVAGMARSLRIDEARIDTLADDVGELVLVGNALAHLSADVERLDGGLGARLRLIQASLDRNLGSLHRNVTAVRMVALAPTLRRLPRMMREIATELGRTVVLAIDGENTEVDKSIADMLYEPLLHLIRNAVDHGVEAPEARRLAGKSAEGRIQLSVRRDGESVVIALSDDGAGIDPDRVRAAAVDRGLIEAGAAADMSEQAVLHLVFAPGFSTARTVTSVSGRGVGMDAVKTAVEAVGGAVAITSRAGQGTTTTLRLPLSVITTKLLLVRAGSDRYGVPFHAILETASVRSESIQPMGSGEVFVFRNRTVPLVHLATLLGAERRFSTQHRLLIIQAGGDRVAIAVDGFDQQIEALVRPPANLLSTLPAIVGTTVLGDG